MPRLEGGFGGDEPQVHVALTAYPIGSRGQVGIGVDLATELRPGGRPEAQHRVRVELATAYERLRAFAVEVARLPDRNGSVAHIAGERLA